MAELEKLCEGVKKALAQGPLDPDGLREATGTLSRSLGEEGKKKGISTTLPTALGHLQVLVKDKALEAAVKETEAYGRDELGDARSFSLDSPKSRAPKIATLRKMIWALQRDRIRSSAPLAPPSRWTTRSFLGLGLTGALSAGAVITGVLARSGAASVNETRFVGDEPPADLLGKRNQAAALAITSDVLAGSAIAALATTLVLTYTGKPGRAQPAKAGALSLEPSLLGASLRGSF